MRKLYEIVTNGEFYLQFQSYLKYLPRIKVDILGDKKNPLIQIPQLNFYQQIFSLIK